MMTLDGIAATYSSTTLTDKDAREFLCIHDKYLTSIDQHVALGNDRTDLSLVAFIPVAKRHAYRSQLSVDKQNPQTKRS